MTCARQLTLHAAAARCMPLSELLWPRRLSCGGALPRSSPRKVLPRLQNFAGGQVVGWSRGFETARLRLQGRWGGLAPAPEGSPWLPRMLLTPSPARHVSGILNQDHSVHAAPCPKRRRARAGVQSCSKRRYRQLTRDKRWREASGTPSSAPPQRCLQRMRSSNTFSVACPKRPRQTAPACGADLLRTQRRLSPISAFAFVQIALAPEFSGVLSRLDEVESAGRPPFPTLRRLSAAAC